MNDVSITDLFWLILKFLAALGLVALIGVALYLVWKAAKLAARTGWDILRGRNASVGATVCFCLVTVVVLGTCAALASGYFHDHSTFLQPQQKVPAPEQNLSSTVPDWRDLCNNSEHVITVSAVREYAKKKGIGPNEAGSDVEQAGCRIVADPQSLPCPEILLRDCIPVFVAALHLE
jgi:hypothetical protein